MSIEDRVEDREQQLQELKQDLMDGKTEPIKSWLQVFVDEGEPEETVSEAQQLIDRIYRDGGQKSFPSDRAGGAEHQLLCCGVHGISGHGRVP
ncbi:MAG: hypothetical protein ACLTZM_08410 [Ruminococcus sp.]